MTSSLPEMLTILCNAPHTHPMALRPYPELFSAEDLALLADDAALPRAGLPPALRRHLISQHRNINASDEMYSFDQASAGAGVADVLLCHPARLVYAMITSINPEEMENTERLCVVTSSLVLLMRENTLRGEAGVLAVLDGLQAIADQKAKSANSSSGSVAPPAAATAAMGAPSAAAAAAPRTAAASAAAYHSVLLTDSATGALTPAVELNIQLTASVTEGFISCGNRKSVEQPGKGGGGGGKKKKTGCTDPLSKEASAAAAIGSGEDLDGSGGDAAAGAGGLCDNVFDYGACKPPSMVDSYIAAHTGCVFKNFFRLLCVWLAHYACSQRYVETLFYCTHVPYAEWKQTALFVWKTLPKYFTL